MSSTPRPFTELALEYTYETPRALPAFYVPVLSRAIRYDRTCGYFRASSLAVAAQGVARFLSNGGKMRLLCGVELREEEVSALQGDAPLPADVANRLKQALTTTDDVQRNRLGVLAWLVREGRLEVQLAIPKAVGSSSYFHEKQALFEDAHGNTICISGSNNESATGWQHNFESFWVRASWKESPEAMEASISAIRQRFDGDLNHFRRVPLTDEIVEEWVKLAPDDLPVTDIEEPVRKPTASTVAKFLSVAPRLRNGEETLTATSAVTPFPHQSENVARLVGTYPRSWLVADEVGLGKTISAGLALRQLVLGGRVRRALVMAPANVCVQWQDELFEKFGLWVPRYADQKLYGAHPDDVTSVAGAANVYAEHDLLLVSSHLARLDAQRSKLLEAPPFDLVVVDEAHHARRKGANPAKREPSKLLRLLDEIRAAGQARSLWLLTATPMQVDPVELYDLLVHVADDPEVVGTDYVQFERLYRQLAQPLKSVAWNYLGKRVGRMPTSLDEAEEALLERIAQRVGAYDAHRIRGWAQTADPVSAAQQLDDASREELRAYVRQRSPVARYVLRHGRGTLRRYKDEGILKEPIAVREVTVRTVDFSVQESDLYRELDDLIDRLTAAHGTAQAAGFILTTYRRRLTSSWAAIYATLLRRVDSEAAYAAGVAEEDAVADDELADDEHDEGTGQTADPRALTLSMSELNEMRRFVDRLAAMNEQDGKFDVLQRDIEEARKDGRPLLVFTQYTDTLNYLRDRLWGAYGAELAQYTGAGGRWFAKPEGQDRCTKQELVEAVRSAKVTVLLCTDAASEGLNLQAASKLINYDLPWNPMRVEQRIGRVDRIGQTAETVEIVNYTIPGTVEEDVYQALAQRIDVFDGLVGELQPILGAVENSFKAIYRQPRSERSKTIKEQLTLIDQKRRQLEGGGVSYSADDLWPKAEQLAPAVDLNGYVDTLRDDLLVDLGALSHPTTADPAFASRDASGWRALATYGHPDLDARVHELATGQIDPAIQVTELGVGAGIARADLSPPTLVETVDGLNDLDVPVSTGDAQTMATAAASAIVRSHEAALERWDAQRARREGAELNRQLRVILHRMLSLQALATGDAASEELWSSLISRPTPAICAKVPGILKRVGVAPDDILAGYGPEQLEVGDVDSEMHATGKELKRWWASWMASKQSQ